MFRLFGKWSQLLINLSDEEKDTEMSGTGFEIKRPPLCLPPPETSSDPHHGPGSWCLLSGFWLKESAAWVSARAFKYFSPFNTFHRRQASPWSNFWKHHLLLSSETQFYHWLATQSITISPSLSLTSLKSNNRIIMLSLPWRIIRRIRWKIVCEGLSKWSSPSRCSLFLKIFLWLLIT